MAANFGHMPGNPMLMMQQQQQQQHFLQQQQQQRQPQQHIQQQALTQAQQQGQLQQQQQSQQNLLQHHIVQQLHSSAQNTGWQASCPVQERYLNVHNIFNSLRTIQSMSKNKTQNVQQILGIAVQFEKDTFLTSQDKATYGKRLDDKLAELMEARRRELGNSQNNGQNHLSQQQLQQQQQAQFQMAQQQLGMANQASMQGFSRPGMVQQPQPAYQHLQHQMTVSALPGQQQPQPHIVMNSNNPMLQQHTGQTNPQLQMTMNNQHPQEIPRNPSWTPVALQQALEQLSRTSPQEQNTVAQVAKNMMQTMSDDARARIRSQYYEQLDQAGKDRLQAAGVDPIMYYIRAMAFMTCRRQQAAAAMQQQLINNAQQSAQQPSQMQAQRSQNAMLAQSNQQQQIGVNPEFNNFLNGVESIVGQQAAGVMAQQGGELVVPVSVNAPNISQPGLSGQGPGSTPQRQRPTGLGQQQQGFNNQQSNVLSTLPATTAQGQARGNAQLKAQQGLHGQPGGMGPMPSQISPAMVTLNTPMRTPQPPSKPEVQQMPTPASASFIPAFDPRFAPGNKANSGPTSNSTNVGSESNMMTGAITPDQRSAMMGVLPQDRLTNGQTEVPAGQMNKQFMVNGQRLPQHMAPGNVALTPQQQQQQFMMRQQMLRNNQQQMQSGQNPQMPTQINPQMALQQNNNQFRISAAEYSRLDQQVVPPEFRQQVPFLQNLPPHVNKWVEVKQFFLQSQPSNSPQLVALMQKIKHLQIKHFQSLVNEMRVREGMPGGQSMAFTGQTPQLGPPGLSSSMEAMTQSQAQSQITQELIDKVRGGSSGKFAAKSDEEIRTMIANNRRNQAGGIPHQLQVPQAPIMPHMVQQMQAQNAQRVSVPQTQGSQTIPQQQVHAQQQKVAQITSTKGAQQSTRPQSSGQNTNVIKSTKVSGTKQAAASPADAKKSLKRSNSDDVVEVPNPNAPQNRANSQKTARPVLDPAEIAKFTPEQKSQTLQAVQDAARPKMNIPQTQQQQAQNQEIMKRCQTIIAEETRRAVTLKELTQTPTERNAALQQLAKLSNPLRSMRLPAFIHRWWFNHQNEDLLRAFWQKKLLVEAQFEDKEQLMRPKSKLSASAGDLLEAYKVTASLLISAQGPAPLHRSQLNTAQGSVPVGAGTYSSVPKPSSPSSTVTNTLQQDQLNSVKAKSHNRSNSRNNVPPAPTTAHPPAFPALSDMSRPFARKAELTQENLKLPIAKRQKHSTNSTPLADQQPTPASMSSPQVKLDSPSVKPAFAEMVNVHNTQQNRIQCAETDCAFHSNDGFKTMDELIKHVADAHVVHDPAQYVMDELHQLLHVESDIAAKSSKGPDDKDASKTETSNGVAATTDVNKATVEVLASQVTSVDVVDSELWGLASINPQDLLTNFGFLESGGDGAISDMNVYRSIKENDANDTPESDKSGVTENSDVSEGVNLNINIDGLFEDTWQPFGPQVSFGDSKPDLENHDDLNNILADYPSYSNDFMELDDLFDPEQLSKPFVLDSSIFPAI